MKSLLWSSLFNASSFYTGDKWLLLTLRTVDLHYLYCIMHNCPVLLKNKEVCCNWTKETSMITIIIASIAGVTVAISCLSSWNFISCIWLEHIKSILFIAQSNWVKNFFLKVMKKCCKFLWDQLIACACLLIFGPLGDIVGKCLYASAVGRKRSNL